MVRFRSFGSRHNLRLPLLFVTHTSELTQSVGSSTLAMIPWSTSESSSFFRGSRRASGTRRGGCTTGGTLGSKVMWNSPLKHPIPSKQSGYCESSFALSSGFPARFEVEPGEDAWRLLSS